MNPDYHHAFRASMLYPSIDPHATGWLDVGDGHQLYWEVCGNPQGKAVVFLHGGPGAGCGPTDRRWFDPAHYRIVLFDQRGCGRSRSQSGLHANTTAHLVADMEALRAHLAIDHWMLFGGSWGATLALAYAQRHPERVSAMVLRGVFTARHAELRWLYQEGASWLFPQAWSNFIAVIPPAERHRLLAAYYERLTGSDRSLADQAAQAWCAWERALMEQPGLPRGLRIAASDPTRNRVLATIEAHYALHGFFLADGELLANASRLANIPAVLIQGGRDYVTPPATAWELRQAWPQAELQLVPDAGHAAGEPEMLRRLLAATNRFAGSGGHRRSDIHFEETAA